MKRYQIEDEVVTGALSVVTRLQGPGVKLFVVIGCNKPSWGQIVQLTMTNTLVSVGISDDVFIWEPKARR